MISVGSGYSNAFKEKESEHLFDALFFFNLASAVFLTLIRLYFHFAKKMTLVKQIFFFDFFLKLHLFYLYLFCGIILFSIEFRESSRAISSGLRFFAFIVTELYAFSNVNGTYSIIALLNSIMAVFDVPVILSLGMLKVKTKTFFTLISIFYIVWTQPCNWFDPLTLHYKKLDGDPFSINPLNIISIFITAVLLAYKVYDVKKSRKPPHILSSCQIIQLISTVTVIECYMIYTHSSALFTGFQLYNRCNFDSYLLLVSLFIHIFYFLSPIVVEIWYRWARRVAPEEEPSVESQ